MWNFLINVSHYLVLLYIPSRIMYVFIKNKLIHSNFMIELIE